MKSSAKTSVRKCVLARSPTGWSPAHCPLEEECLYWSRLEDRCRYEDRLRQEAQQVQDEPSEKVPRQREAAGVEAFQPTIRA